MAWSYRRRIKIIPGVHLNLSKKGISTSIGVKGASVTFGPSGTYVNTSIPGLGISNRQKISKTSKTTPEVLPDTYPQQLATDEDNIFSMDVEEITSQDMQGIKQAIIASGQQRATLKKDLGKIKATLLASRLKLGASYTFIYGLIKKDIPV